MAVKKTGKKRNCLYGYNVSFRVDKDLYERFKKNLRIHQLGVSAYLRACMENFVDESEHDNNPKRM